MQNRVNISDKGAFLDIYVEKTEKLRDGILILPGGGYYNVCEEREGYPIAKAFLERGVNAFVLTYTTGENVRFPSHLNEVAQAMKYIKDNSDELSVNPERIFVLGFSAGGHLAGSISVMHGEAEQMLGIPENSARPAGTVYCYPVVSAYHPTHGGSFYNLTGKNTAEMTEEEKARFSIDMRVSQKTPPAFIWHTVDDEIVPIAGTLKLLESYVKNGVTVTAHIYPKGPHGMALANKVTECGNPGWVSELVEGWVDYAVKFFKTV